MPRVGKGDLTWLIGRRQGRPEISSRVPGASGGVERVAGSRPPPGPPSPPKAFHIRSAIATNALCGLGFPLSSTPLTRVLSASELAGEVEGLATVLMPLSSGVCPARGNLERRSTATTAHVAPVVVVRVPAFLTGLRALASVSGDSRSTVLAIAAQGPLLRVKAESVFRCCH